MKYDERMTTASHPIHLRLAFWGLVALMAWAPLPLGSNRPWSAALLALLSAVLLAGLAIGNLIARRDAASLPRGLWLPLALAFVPVLWVLSQWSPWTPEAWHHPVWGQTADTLGVPLDGRITVNPDATLSTLMNLLAYLAIFWTAVTTARDPTRARLALQVFVWIGTAYALYGLIVFFSGSETILFFDKWDYFGSVTSTFVNRNSYATYAGLGLICAVGLIIEEIRQNLPRRAHRLANFAPLAANLASRNVPLLVAIVLLGCALVLTGSRGGVASTVVALAVLFGFSMLGRRGAGAKGLVVAAPIILLVLVTVWAASGPLAERMEESPLTSDRIPAYKLTLQAIENAPILGNGYGSFQESFASQRDLSVASPSSWKKAHNTYLENALELGLPAAVTLNLAIALVAWRAFHAASMRRRSRLYLLLGVSATVLVSIHSLVDFSLQIPAVAAAYAFIMGIAAAQTFRDDKT